MAKGNKSDLVGNLIQKRKLMDSIGEGSEETLKSLGKQEESKGEGQADKPEAQAEGAGEEPDSATPAPGSQPKPKKQAPEAAPRELGKVDSILSGLKGTKKQDKYSSIKIKTDVYNRLKKIARKEGIDRHGHLIDRVLNDFCDRYDGK